jgi:hypothetical protein
MPRPIYPSESLQYQLDRRVDGPQNQPRQRTEEKIIDRTGSRTRTSLSSNP